MLASISWQELHVVKKKSAKTTTIHKRSGGWVGSCQFMLLSIPTCLYDWGWSPTRNSPHTAASTLEVNVNMPDLGSWSGRWRVFHAGIAVLKNGTSCLASILRQQQPNFRYHLQSTRQVSFVFAEAVNLKCHTPKKVTITYSTCSGWKISSLLNCKYHLLVRSGLESAGICPNNMCISLTLISWPPV